ncbi:MAG: protease inhibitor I42 family protein, partial [Halobacteriota archaeon]
PALIISGHQIIAAPGQQFSIGLPEHPYPYKWQPTFETSTLSLIGDTYIPPAKPLPGAPRTHVFTFQALKAGTTSLMFNYIPSSGQGPALNSTSYTVIVE